MPNADSLLEISKPANYSGSQADMEGMFFGKFSSFGVLQYVSKTTCSGVL